MVTVQRNIGEDEAVSPLLPYRVLRSMREFSGW